MPCLACSMFLPLLKVMKTATMSIRQVKAIFTLAIFFAQMPAISLIFSPVLLTLATHHKQKWFLCVLPPKEAKVTRGGIITTSYRWCSHQQILPLLKSLIELCPQLSLKPGVAHFLYDLSFLTRCFHSFQEEDFREIHAWPNCIPCLLQLKPVLRLIYIGKVCWQKLQRYCDAITPPLLALPYLGDSTQIRWFLFVKCGQGK